MKMTFYNPTSLIVGNRCVVSNAKLFAQYGKRCLIVTGRTAARASGALLDLLTALDIAGVSCALFSDVEANPSYATCLAAAELAKREGAEFIVGVGGGSPLDAAKAIAALAACRDTSEEALFSARFDAEPLPILAIGTTAGTGSEVTPVAVITTSGGQKKSFRAPALYPRVAFGDAAYTMSLSPAFTRSTALDALAHCLESYFNRTANDLSRTLATRGVAILAAMLEKTAVCDTVPLSYEEREALYCASIYGGYAISVTGTAFPHAFGYFLSESRGIPHGNACALYLEEFIRYNAAVAPKESARLFAEAGCDEDTLLSLVRKNLPRIEVTLTEEELASLLPRYQKNKSLEKCLGEVDGSFAAALLRKKFIK